MSLRIPDSVSSKQDLAALILEIHDYAKWFAHNEIKQRAHAKGASLPPEMSPVAMEMIRSWNGNKLLSQRSLEDLIDALEKFAKRARTVTITLAAPPPSKLKQDLVAWCRTNIAPDIVVSFQFNSTLLGGLVVRLGSHVFDWSFRRQIIENRHRFPEVLKSV